MNKVILMGRLTRNPELRYTDDSETLAITKYTLAVPRGYKRDGENADFINCVTFGKTALVAEKYLQQGMRVIVSGRLQTGHYVNGDGNKIYTVEVVVDEHDFVELKKNEREHEKNDEFMAMPKDLEEQLPFVP